MATSGSVTGTVKSTGYIYMEWYNVNRNNAANTSGIDQYLKFQLTDNTAVNAAETGSLWINGSGQNYNNGVCSRGTNSGWTLNSRGTGFGHDVNGNLAVGGLAGYFTSGWSFLGSFSVPDFTVYTERLPLAPSIGSTASSNLTTNGATIAGAVSSHGHGTSSTITYFLRESGVGSYVNKGTGSSKAITGLKPNTTYQWYITATNNNGDGPTTSAVQTFKTKSGVKVILPSGTVEDRVVKQILPTGVVTERVVTKIV